MLNQFARTQLLIGSEGMNRLANARVAVFGIGGVGEYVCEALVMKAQELHIPIISSMGAGNKLDPTAFRVADIYKTRVCPPCKGDANRVPQTKGQKTQSSIFRGTAYAPDRRYVNILPYTLHLSSRSKA